jgi:hypothetical protein
MPSSTKPLIPQLLQRSEVLDHQQRLAAHCAQILSDQGFQSLGTPTSELIDTGVGFMHRMSLDVADFSSSVTLELRIYVLAKVDGSVHCWSELWGPVIEQEEVQVLARTPAADASQAPRLRLARHNLFTGTIGSKWSRSKDPVAAAYAALLTQGFFELERKTSPLKSLLVDAVTV